ncbi:MAG: DUF1648 domain-containing protein [Ruminococcaceae bacterium]|nr:DUF1648 domain-containing protein [Oscillospiraceae bacterium]
MIMIKRNKLKLIISSILIFLPSVAGVILWDRLPEIMTTHWGADGNADGFASKALAVFVMPLILLALHWICIFITVKDPKNKGQNNKVFGIVLWITPMISIFANTVVYAVSLGMELDLMTYTMLLMGLMFTVIGNYMPKCKQNFTLGIKIKWTLENEENWNATHRFAGKVWFIGGVLLMICAFVQESLFMYLLVGAIFVLVLMPTVYSYLYYKKQVKSGTAPEKIQLSMNKSFKIGGTAGVIVAIIIAIVLLFICFTGEIEYRFDSESFTIEASYYNDLTVEYDVIDSIEYREDCKAGSRVSGFGSPVLSTGVFKNDEFGYYTRYSYTGCDACVVIEVDGKVLVITAKDNKDTKQIYQELISRQ